MATIVDRSGMVDLLRDEYAALGSLGADLSDGQWDAPTCLPGWTVRDVLAHVIGTESMLCGEPAPAVEISHLTHMRNPVAEANEVWVESMRPLAGAEMVARLSDVTARRLAALEAMTQADFDAPSWTPAGRDETYGRFMRIRHYDCFMHEHDVRAALSLPARPEPRALRSALEEVATGLGYIVGRRAALPDGSRVRVEVTGPAATSYLVAVEGRAGLVDAFDRPPTVGIRLPAALFLRLTGGRQDGAATEDEVTYSGDRGLGRRLVDNLAFTI